MTALIYYFDYGYFAFFRKMGPRTKKGDHLEKCNVCISAELFHVYVEQKLWQKYAAFFLLDEGEGD